MSKTQYVPSLSVGISQTFGGGLAIGGGGKFDPRVKSVASAHGMRISATTGEWYTADRAQYDAALAALLSA